MGEQAEPQIIDTCMWLGKISAIIRNAFFLLFHHLRRKRALSCRANVHWICGIN